MVGSMSSKTSHPNIAKITRQIELIDYYYLDSRFYDAWAAISMVMRGLKPQHKRTDDYTKLYREIQYAIRRVNSDRFLNAPDAEVKRIMLAARLDMDFHSRFMSLMWTCKMLSEGAYSFFDPSSDKDSDEVKLSLGERDTTGIR